MERPILTLTTKDFLTGIAPSAHTERGGLFHTAPGITPLYDAGGTASTENGLLQAGPAPTDFSSGISDVIFAGDVGYVSGTPYLFMLGNSGHLYQKSIGSGAVTDLRSATPITSPRNGLAVFEFSGANRLFYFQDTQVGLWNLSGTYPTGWTDNAYTSLTSGQHPTHKFLDRLFFGNVNSIGFFQTDGTASLSALDLPTTLTVTALSDDGTFLAIATTENSQGSNNFALNKILFWDTNASSWQRDYAIRDPFIWALKRIGRAVYAFGQYGIYEVSFDGGVRKVLSSLIGFGTTTDLTAGYGANRAAVYNQDALVFGTDETIDTFGRLSIEVPTAYFKPFLVPDGVGTPSFVFSSFDVGRVYVATDANKLYAYDFNAATRETNVNFATIYIPLKQPIQVHRIDVIFGAPITSGDIFTPTIRSDVDTSYTFEQLSFATHGAKNRYPFYALTPLVAQNQLSVSGNFGAGAVKIKSIEVYGQPMTP